MKKAIFNFLRDEEGATAIEYGIIAGAMAVVLVVIFGPTGTITSALTTMFSGIAGALTAATPS